MAAVVKVTMTTEGMVDTDVDQDINHVVFSSNLSFKQTSLIEQVLVFNKATYL